MLSRPVVAMTYPVIQLTEAVIFHSAW